MKRNGENGGSVCAFVCCESEVKYSLYLVYNYIPAHQVCQSHQ